MKGDTLVATVLTFALVEVGCVVEAALWRRPGMLPPLAAAIPSWRSSTPSVFGAGSRSRQEEMEKERVLSPILLRGGSTLMEDNDDKSSEESHGEATDDEEEEGEEDEGGLSKAAPVSDLPVSITMTTALGHTLMDVSIELDAKQSRTIGFLKERLRKLLPGKPPVSSIHLVLDGRRLHDDVVVRDIIEEEEEDPEDEEGTSVGLILFIDMIPPVDPRFVTHIEEQLSDMTTSDLLQAFAVNEAALLKNAFLLENDFKRAASLDHAETLKADKGDEIDDSVAMEGSLDSAEGSVHSEGPVMYVELREESARIRSDLEQTVLGVPKAREILSDTTPPSQQRPQLEVSGQRVRVPRKGGRTAMIREGIQRNLNVNWGDTFRYCVLFILFGYFGGRTPASRAILLLGAPSVFVLQARPVKLLIKQLLYAICDHPPGIFLSLLPAPQQAILNLNYEESMGLLYSSLSEEPAGRQSNLGGDSDSSDRDSDSEDDL